MKTKTGWMALGTQLGMMVGDKDEAYGHAITDGTVAILQVLYPNGITPDDYSDLPLIVVMINKLLRITRGNKLAFKETPYLDLAGYAMLGWEKEMPTDDEESS